MQGRGADPSLGQAQARPARSEDQGVALLLDRVAVYWTGRRRASVLPRAGRLRQRPPPGAIKKSEAWEWSLAEDAARAVAKAATGEGDLGGGPRARRASASRRAVGLEARSHNADEARAVDAQSINKKRGKVHANRDQYVNGRAIVRNYNNNE